LYHPLLKKKNQNVYQSWGHKAKVRPAAKVKMLVVMMAAIEFFNPASQAEVTGPNPGTRAKLAAGMGRTGQVIKLCGGYRGFRFATLHTVKTLGTKLLCLERWFSALIIH
jgi:hypothetical protein